MILEMVLAYKDVEVKMFRVTNENATLIHVIRECNIYDLGLVRDVYHNSGGEDCFEVFYYSGGGTSKILAQNIGAEVKIVD